MTFIRPLRLNYGNGSDGAGTLSGTVSKQIYQLADGASISGLTLSASYKPTIIRCNGTVTISGAIQGNGLGFVGGPAADSADKRGNSGYGLEPGRAGETASNGGHAGTSPLANFVDWLFGAGLVPTAGAGGGSGGGNNSGSGAYGGAGGAGGASLYIVARRAVFASTASITLNGATGQALTKTGGDGTGGVLGVAADSIELASSGNLISAVSLGSGAAGLVYLAYLRSISGDTAARCNPDAIAINLATLPIALA